MSTDGGNWSLLHMYECLRNSNARPAFAVSMTAVLPSQCRDSPILAFCDGLWQNMVLAGLKIPHVILPQRGTVTASALDLALMLTSGKIYFTGVDLSHNDIISHARPYSFDRLWNDSATRFNPYYSQVFRRSNAGSSFNIYASWFSNQLASYPKRLFSLGANNQVFRQLETAAFDVNENAGKPAFNIAKYSSAENPAGLAVNFLLAGLDDIQFGRELYSELSALLLPGKTASADELKETVLTLAKAAVKQQ